MNYDVEISSRAIETGEKRQDLNREASKCWVVLSQRDLNNSQPVSGQVLAGDGTRGKKVGLAKSEVLLSDSDGRDGLVGQSEQPVNLG